MKHLRHLTSFRRLVRLLGAQHAAPLLFLLAAVPAAAAIDPFYLSLLRDGQHAYDRKDYTAAKRDLRLACFGMLDEPRQLADCLVRLALAQDRLNDVDEFRETFQRLVDVEERFKAYSQGGVAPELRAALEQRLAARIPAATLATAPAFRSTTAAKPDPAGAGKAAPPRRKGGEKPETRGSSPEATPPASGAAAPVNSKAAPAAATSPGPQQPPLAAAKPAPADPSAPRPLTEAERAKLDQARRLLAERRTARELREAYQLAREVADTHPDLKEAQHLAAEGAYRISRWSDAATYFRRGGDPGDDEPERLFYMAVAFFESGDTTAAAAALKRSLPNLQRTPYVDSYAKKILGQ
ncbi:MAG TPA: hypothetical protein VGX68_29860 [Thermoanaerobaculia bacterium]|jgi:tetratricopeptide (TPR) repeat protein|nr:hypothetical protein [Thermoanaerobaculia bacterium]